MEKIHIWKHFLGTSLVIVNSEKGKALFEEISSMIKSEKVDFFIEIKPNPSMNTVSTWNSKSDDFFDDIDKIPFDELVKNTYQSHQLLKK